MVTLICLLMKLIFIVFLVILIMVSQQYYLISYSSFCHGFLGNFCGATVGFSEVSICWSTKCSGFYFNSSRGIYMISCSELIDNSHYVYGCLFISRNVFLLCWISKCNGCICLGFDCDALLSIFSFQVRKSYINWFAPFAIILKTLSINQFLDYEKNP